MPECVLRVIGRDFDPKVAPLGTTTPHGVFVRGEPVRQSSKRVNETSGITWVVSESSDDLAKQVEGAISFLRVHARDIARIVAMPGVDEAYLDFGYTFRIGGGVAVQVDCLPVELVTLAATVPLGIMLSLYPSPESDRP